jgi:hypothetical protein
MLGISPQLGALLFKDFILVTQKLEKLGFVYGNCGVLLAEPPEVQEYV